MEEAAGAWREVNDWLGDKATVAAGESVITGGK